MDASGTSMALRDKHVPLPTRDDDYRQVLLLGTTGAGKTTVVRQLLGTDPDRDRFPSTSTAKTTVSDTEIVLAEGPFQAVVTFFPKAEIVRHLEECAIRAAASILGGLEAATVRDHLLDHEQQRFRFSYVLGRRTGPEESSLTETDPFDVFDDLDFDAVEDSASFDADPQAFRTINLDDTEAVLRRVLDSLRLLVEVNEESIRQELDVTDAEDEDDVKALLAEDLERRIREAPEFTRAIESLLAEIDKRFSALSVGEIDRGDDGWPRSWVWASPDRKAFLQAVNRFSSNYAPLFGHLLSPIVDGIRVSGPFAPTWNNGQIPRFVLVDGQGLGHTPASAAALSTPVTEWIDKVDAVLLVDNATQPMQAGPAIAIRSILTSGNVEKLVFCFTHFDEVTGDNLSTQKERAKHVLGSASNLVTTIGSDFNPRAERSLRRRLDEATVFLARIDKPLDSTGNDGVVSARSFRKLHDLVMKAGERPDLGPARPVYAAADLRRAVESGVGKFHHRWDAILGLIANRNVAKEHWTRIKALNKRFLEERDEYDTLRPSADLREYVKEELYKKLESPREWRGQRPDEEGALTAIVDEFSQAIARQLNAPIRERLQVAALESWRRAFALYGPGSTRVRAEHIAHDIIDVFVPNPEDGNDAFSDVLLGIIHDSATEVGVVLEY